MRKKLFAVIMSAMMMITFMPTMAFALTPDTGSVSWNDTFSHVSYTVTESGATDNYDCDANRYAWGTSNKASSSDQFAGLMKAVPKTEDSVGSKTFYDFDNAKVSKIGTFTIPRNNKITVAQAQQLFGTDFTNEVGVSVVTFSVPSYAKNFNDPGVGEYSVGDQTAQVGGDVLGTAGFTFKIAAPAYDFSKQYTEDQTFELTVISEYALDASFVGTLPAVKLIIVKDDVNVNSIDATDYVFKDKFNKVYDGSEHTLSQKDITGITSTYELYNNKTGKYEKVDAVKVKNAGTYNVKATAKDSKGKTKVTTFSIVVEKANKLRIGFDDDGYNVAGDFEPTKYLYVHYTVSGSEDQLKSSKKAVSKDKAQIIKFQKEAFNITKEKNADGSYECNIEEKEAAEFAAAKKNYAELLANYNEYEFDESSATFYVVKSIDFKTAPLTKSYKAKKGKLPKNKTFKIKAKASDGSELVYKLTKGAGKIVINKSTGKVTVKKGLKKGTYKVGVYAIDLDSYYSDYPLENHYTLKIKVK